MAAEVARSKVKRQLQFFRRALDLPRVQQRFSEGGVVPGLEIRIKPERSGGQQRCRSRERQQQRGPQGRVRSAAPPFVPAFPKAPVGHALQR